MKTWNIVNIYALLLYISAFKERLFAYALLVPPIQIISGSGNIIESSKMRTFWYYIIWLKDKVYTQVDWLTC